MEGGQQWGRTVESEKEKGASEGPGTRAAEAERGECDEEGDDSGGGGVGIREGKGRVVWPGSQY